MSQNGLDVIPLLMEDSQRAKTARNKSDRSCEGMSCGLDVEPEVASREVQKQRDKMKRTLIFAAASACLLAACSAQASFVFGYGGATANQTGDYILGNNFSVNTPIQVTQLGVFSQDAPIAGSVSVGLYQNAGSSGSWTLVGTIQTITAANETLNAGAQIDYINVSPITLGPGLYSVVTATSSDYNSGNPDTGVSAVTFNNLGGAVTDGTYDIWNPGTSLGSSLSGMQTTGPGNPIYPWPLPVFGAGTLSASAVPEPTTVIAGALLLLPFGASTLRILRKSRAA